MGMSASQAKLMALTGRLSDLEYSAQNISGRRLELAKHSEEITDDYISALNAKKLTIKSGWNGSTVSYQDMTYNLLTSPNQNLNAQYSLNDNFGRVLITKDMESKFLGSDGKPVSLEKFLKTMDTVSTPPGYDELMGAYERANSNLQAVLDGNPYDSSNPDHLAALIAVNMADNEEFAAARGAVITNGGENNEYYTNLYNKMIAGYVTMPNEESTINDPQWLYDQMKSGNLHLEKYDTNDGWKDNNWGSNLDLMEEDDDSRVAIVKAKYEADMAKVENEDSAFELSLKDIDTEHTAIQTDIDSVKKVIDKNIERNFKSFA